MSKNRRETRKVELVETNNIAMALDRLKKHGDWRRALYHAMCMSYTGNYVTQQKVREAMELP